MIVTIRALFSTERPEFTGVRRRLFHECRSGIQAFALGLKQAIESRAAFFRQRPSTSGSRDAFDAVPTTIPRRSRVVRFPAVEAEQIRRDREWSSGTRIGRPTQCRGGRAPGQGAGACGIRDQLRRGERVTLRKCTESYGRRGEARTPDPGLVRAVLSQLSYPPVVELFDSCREDLSAGGLTVPGIVPASRRVASWKSAGLTMW